MEFLLQYILNNFGNIDLMYIKIMQIGSWLENFKGSLRNQSKTIMKMPKKKIDRDINPILTFHSYLYIPIFLVTWRVPLELVQVPAAALVWRHLPSIVYLSVLVCPLETLILKQITLTVRGNYSEFSFNVPLSVMSV